MSKTVKIIIGIIIILALWYILKKKKAATATPPPPPLTAPGIGQVNSTPPSQGGLPNQDNIGSAAASGAQSGLQDALSDNGPQLGDVAG